MRPARPSPWIACCLCVVGAFAMTLVAWLTGLPFAIPSLGGSLVLAATEPERPEASARALVLGHGIAIAAALGALAAYGLLAEPSAFVAGVTLARVGAVSTALGFALAGMLAAGTVHVPAGATALLVALGIVRAGADTVVLAGTVLWVGVVVAAFPRLTARLEAVTGRPTRSRGTPRRRRARQAT